MTRLCFTKWPSAPDGPGLSEKHVTMSVISVTINHLCSSATSNRFQQDRRRFQHWYRIRREGRTARNLLATGCSTAPTARLPVVSINFFVTEGHAVSETSVPNATKGRFDHPKQLLLLLAPLVQ